MRIWIDTDIGSDVDDALTLAYVLAHPQIEVVGISTVFGDVALRTRIARELLAIAGRSDVDVLSGLGVPLSPRKRGVMFGHEGKGLLADADPVLRVADEVGGDRRIDAIGNAIDASAADAILAIGPLTNLGALISAGADLPPLTIMGGKLSDVMLPGMVESISEWNWFCDPTAVQITLGASHEQPPLVVPAEVTFQTQLDDGDPGVLAQGGELNQALSRLCVAWLELQRDEFGRAEPRIALHDPLTAALLVRPELCATEPRRVRVEDDGASVLLGGEPNLRAAIDVDPTAVRDHIMQVLTDSESAAAT